MRYLNIFSTRCKILSVEEKRKVNLSIYKNNYILINQILENHLYMRTSFLLQVSTAEGQEDFQVGKKIPRKSFLRRINKRTYDRQTYKRKDNGESNDINQNDALVLKYQYFCHLLTFVIVLIPETVSSSVGNWYIRMPLLTNSLIIFFLNSCSSVLEMLSALPITGIMFTYE